jgi:hypothetical protein
MTKFYYIYWEMYQYKTILFSFTLFTSVWYEGTAVAAPSLCVLSKDAIFCLGTSVNLHETAKRWQIKGRINNYTTIFDLNHFILSMTYFLVSGLFQEIVSAKYLRNFQAIMLSPFVLTYFQHKIAIIAISTDPISFWFHFISQWLSLLLATCCKLTSSSAMKIDLVTLLAYRQKVFPKNKLKYTPFR